MVSLLSSLHPFAWQAVAKKRENVLYTCIVWVCVYMVGGPTINTKVTIATPSDVGYTLCSVWVEKKGPPLTVF